MSIDPHRVQVLFLTAVELTDPDARRKLLDRECVDDNDLRQRVEALLGAHDAVNGFGNQPSRDSFARTIETTPGMRPGTVLSGRYKLLEAIGEGGMGTVWVAEQVAPVRRKVAVKLVKAGMDSRQVLSRFEAERQALAVMDHPSIAKVFDGGMTDQGHPFFVMEYVKGVPITEYCDAARVSLKERLNLFMQVCQAVQHAHQKGIIHRDLKPSNILVCLYDGGPVPKVIDFGLAKAMHQSLTEHTLHTPHGLILGTPLYMSPEQAELNNLDVDTRTDIYSLGVILYELLTGSTPLERLQFKQVALNEMLRLIKEVDPPKPSTRLSGSVALPSIAAQRGVEPTQLCRSLRGDLDWIVMKSLEKERRRRYETADALFDDLKRYLQDEPVAAAAPTRLYRLQKFVRRNRLSVITASLVFFSILAGAIAAGVGFWAEAEQRQIAQDREQEALTQAQNAWAVSLFLSEMLQSAEPLSGQGENVTVLQALQVAERKLDAGRFADNPIVESSIRRAIGQTQLQLGRHPDSIRNLERALQLRRNHMSPDHEDVALSLCDLGTAYFSAGRIKDAEAPLNESLEIRRARDDDPKLARTVFFVAQLNEAQGKYDKAELLYREVLDRAPNSDDIEDTDLANIYASLGSLHMFQQRYAEAEAALLKGLEICRVRLPKNSVYTAKVLHDLGQVHAQQMQFADAEPCYKESLDILNEVMPAEYPATALTKLGYAEVIHRLRKDPKAPQLADEAIATLRRNFPDGSPELASALHNRGMMWMEHGDLEKATDVTLEAIKMCGKVLPQGHPFTAHFRCTYGVLLAKQGRFKDAEGVLRSVIPELIALEGPASTDAARSRATLGSILTDLARFKDAEPELLAAAQVLQQTPLQGSNDLSPCLTKLIALYESWDKAEPNQGYFEKSLEWRRKLAALPMPTPKSQAPASP